MQKFNIIGKPLLGEKYVEGKKKKNIAFARGGAHLPIAHELRLPETEIISWGGDFCSTHPIIITLHSVELS